MAVTHVRPTVEFVCTTVKLEARVGVDGSEAKLAHAASPESTELGDGGSTKGRKLGGDEGTDTADDRGAGISSWAGGISDLVDGKKSKLTKVLVRMLASGIAHWVLPGHWEALRDGSSGLGYGQPYLGDR